MKLNLRTIIMVVTVLNEAQTCFFTINGDKEIKQFSQSFLRIWVILRHIDTVMIHIVIMIFLLLSIVL